MTSSEIRQQFLDFFKNKEHKIVQSSPVVPYEDPTLLFANAGMNQFKDVFLGKGTRDYKRAANSQKCIRVSGKHNDLEEVGYDTYHHTFFEMLGNWSFGDYYKAEAIEWAWELLTVVWKLPKERLWATVYRTDDEAFQLWKSKTDINPAHILRFDEKDNFWEMGETGPCGPCSEIHINLSDDLENPSLVNAGKPECIEIWNLVFIQYNRDENGTLHELPAKHVDTGMGFERVCAVLQNKSSNYDSDVFMPLIDKISVISGVKYDSEEHKIPMRVIADHIRTLTFAIADGATPGNEGRGYVLRRILRRASRYGRKLNLREPFLYSLVDILVDNMGKMFPEISEKQGLIKKIIRSEEESFNKTLDRGIELFEGITENLKKNNQSRMSGQDAFRLYDTFGFPLDLTNVMAKETGITIDEAGFNDLMNEQKERARTANKNKLAQINISDLDLNGLDLANLHSEFTGYDTLVDRAKITAFKQDGTNVLIVLDRTPFYAESGGQVSDEGIIEISDTSLPIISLVKYNNLVIHIADNPADVVIHEGIEVTARVNEVRRLDIMRNHSVTHFVHAALRKIAGTHVQQAGSFVGPDYLRFDFTHFAKLTDDEIYEIETLVNKQLRRNLELHHHRNVPFEEAKKMGALMFFGDNYGEKVNVVQFGDFTLEFCGGTHVKNSSQIGLFKIISESSIASGVRRIEAVTGRGVEELIRKQEDKIAFEQKRIEEILEEKRRLEKELAEFKLKEKMKQIPDILASYTDVNGIQLYKGRVRVENMDELKSFGDEIRNRIKNGVGILVSEIDGKVGLVCVVSDLLVKDKNLSAGKIVGDLARLVGGGGGGKPHLATAGGKDITKINAALEESENIVRKYIN